MVGDESRGVGCSWKTISLTKHVCVFASGPLKKRNGARAAAPPGFNSAWWQKPAVPLLFMRLADVSTRVRICQWNPKYGCKSTVTTRFALIALVAWQY